MYMYIIRMTEMFRSIRFMIDGYTVHKRKYMYMYERKKSIV